MLNVWRDMKRVLYYELLQPRHTVEEKRPYCKVDSASNNNGPWGSTQPIHQILLHLISIYYSTIWI